MLTTDDYLEAASVAAPLFGLAASSISLLSHSENVVCQLTMSDGTRAALRIHRPGYNSLAELRSEVLWVTSLSNFGIPVPTALSTDTGDHYVSLPVGGQAHHVGVVDWVPGEPLGSPTGVNGPEVVQHYGRIGKLAAQVRAHHAGWVPPAGFTRRAWDAPWASWIRASLGPVLGGRRIVRRATPTLLGVSRSATARLH